MENENKPLSEEQKVRNHRISMIVAVIFSGISCFAYQKWVLISATIALTLFVIALMAVIANQAERRKTSYEKIQKSMLDKLASVSKFAAVKAAGSVSCAGFHQPKEPKALQNLKK